MVCPDSHPLAGGLLRRSQAALNGFFQDFAEGPPPLSGQLTKLAQNAITDVDCGSHKDIMMLKSDSVNHRIPIDGDPPKLDGQSP
jgi:hypothetical protein